MRPIQREISWSSLNLGTITQRHITALALELGGFTVPCSHLRILGSHPMGDASQGRKGGRLTFSLHEPRPAICGLDVQAIVTNPHIRVKLGLSAGLAVGHMRVLWGRAEEAAYVRVA